MKVRGPYVAPVVFGQNKKKHWRVRHIKYDDRHCHIDCSLGNKLVSEIMKAANKGCTEEWYSPYMIYNINRLWFGNNFMENPRINNDDLTTNDPHKRIKNYSKKRGSKGYIDNHAHLSKRR